MKRLLILFACCATLQAQPKIDWRNIDFKNNTGCLYNSGTAMSWVACSGTNYWTRAAGVLYPTNANDVVKISYASGIPSLTFDHTGETSFKSQIVFQDDGVTKAIFGVDLNGDATDTMFAWPKVAVMNSATGANETVLTGWNISTQANSLNIGVLGNSTGVGSGSAINVGVQGTASGGPSNVAIRTVSGYPAAGANNYAIKSDSAAQSTFAGSITTTQLTVTPNGANIAAGGLAVSSGSPDGAYGEQIRLNLGGQTSDWSHHIYSSHSSGDYANLIKVTMATGQTTHIDAAVLSATAGLTLASGLTVTAGGAYITAGNLGIGTAQTANAGMRITGNIPASGGVAYSAIYGGNLTAAANNDALYALRLYPVAVPGGYTGTILYGLSIENITGAATNIGFYNSASTYFNSYVGIGVAPASNAGIYSALSTTALSGAAYAFNLNPTLVAAANSDAMYGLRINPSTTLGAYTGTQTDTLFVANVVGNADNLKNTGIEIYLPTITLPFSDDYYGPSMMWTGGYQWGTYQGAWRQYFGAHEQSWALQYNAPWYYTTNAVGVRDAAAPWARARFNVAEGDSGKNDFEIVFSKYDAAGTAVTVGDAGQYYLYDGRIEAATSDGSAQPARMLITVPYQMEAVYGLRDGGLETAMRLSDNDEYYKYSLQRWQTGLAYYEIADNGSGEIRITAFNHPLYTGQRIEAFGEDGSGGLNMNGTWTVTKIDANHFDLDGSTYSDVCGACSTGTITAYADYSGTVPGTVKATDVGHGLTVGWTYYSTVIDGSANYDGVYNIVIIDADSFYFVHIWDGPEIVASYWYTKGNGDISYPLLEFLAMNMSTGLTTIANGLQLGIISSAVHPSTGSLKFAHMSSGHLTTITSGNASAAVTYTLPTAAPASSGYVLSSTTGGVMSWVAAATGDVTAASNLTDNAIVRGDGGAKGVQTSTATLDDSGNLAVAGSITATKTSTQLKVAYDGSNYVSFTTGSGGAVDFSGTGAAPYVNINMPAYVWANIAASRGFVVAGANGASADIFSVDDYSSNYAIKVTKDKYFYSSTYAEFVGNVTFKGANNYLDSTASLLFQERSTTPADPNQDDQARIYFKGNLLVLMFNDGGTVRYKYLDLTGTGVTWVHTTTAP